MLPASAAAAAWGLLVLVVCAGGRDLGRVHISHQTVKDSSHPGPGQERAGVAGARGVARRLLRSLAVPSSSQCNYRGEGRNKKCSNGLGNSSSGGRRSRCTARDSCRRPHPLSASRAARLLAQRGPGRGRKAEGPGVVGPGLGPPEEVGAGGSPERLYDCLWGGSCRGG